MRFSIAMFPAFFHGLAIYESADVRAAEEHVCEYW